MRALVFQGVLAALLAIIPVTASAAIFDDGNDRKLIKDLRAKEPASLTAEEKAILAAADKVGAFGFCNGTKGGNASFIRYDGKPAVIVSAHLILDKKTGRLKCSVDSFAAIYMPNANYYDRSQPDRDKDFIYRKASVVFPPANWDALKRGNVPYEDDFAVFYLQEDISHDLMPDGTLRGSLSFSKSDPAEANLYMLGVAKDIGGSIEMVYQARCDGFLKYGRFFHSCDTLKESSGSLMATYEDGELKFRGIHTAGKEDRNLPASLASDPEKANIATGSEWVQASSSNTSKPLLAYAVQWVLHRADCYSGKLDNQWGPTSRKALAAFAAAAEIELPGTEPSPELLAAVERAAPEGAEVCRR